MLAHAPPPLTLCVDHTLRIGEVTACIVFVAEWYVPGLACRRRWFEGGLGCSARRGEPALCACGASKLTSSVWYSGQGVARRPDSARFESGGGLEMRRFRVIVYEYLHIYITSRLFFLGNHVLGIAPPPPFGLKGCMGLGCGER